MLQVERSAILSTFIKLPIVKIFVLFIFDWPFYTGFTVDNKCSAFKNDFKNCQGDEYHFKMCLSNDLYPILPHSN